MMPSQTQCIQSIGKLSGMSTSRPKIFFPLMPKTGIPVDSAISAYLLVSCAALVATLDEVELFI